MPASVEVELVTLRPCSLGERLCVWHLPTTHVVPQALVLHVHGFAEEMNKSRRMVALQSRALAEAGYVVLRVDLLGCGDSAGDFGDATWNDWLGDVQAAIELMRSRHAHDWPGAPLPSVWLWGQRMGCLLAAQAAASSGPCHLLFWQAAGSGKQLLQQFLRLQSAGALLGKTEGGQATAKDELAAGRAVELAGYTISPKLARGLEDARLSPPKPSAGARLEWLDVQPQATAEPSPVVQQALRDWAVAGWALRHHVVSGPAFWQTTEIEDAPALIAATLSALQGGGTSPAALPTSPAHMAVVA